jgi:hypothetical protein
MSSSKTKLRRILTPASSLILPDYIDAGRRPEMGRWNDLIYVRTRTELQGRLDKESLPNALALLFAQQLDVGFIRDDLKLMRCFKCHSQHDRRLYFLGQFNPVRADRLKGSGRIIPPPGVETKKTRSAKCYLCADNVRWQSRGIQLYYELIVNGNPYHALVNPFPFMPNHTTIASAEHEPQTWHRSALWRGDKTLRLVSDLYALADALPGYVCFYNGDGAGASIEEHFHYQAFQTPPGHGPFPLQRVAGLVMLQNEESAAALTSGDHLVTAMNSEQYPLNAFRISGTRQGVIQAAVGWLKQWTKLVDESASANIAAVREKGEIVLYLVPRNRFFSKSTGLDGIVGGLEALGEFIFCTPEEQALISRQDVNFRHMSSVLEGVRPPNIERLNE